MNEKKKMIILLPAMYIGGVERSLLGLLEALDYEKVEVDLFLNRHRGEFLGLIPERVRLLPEIREYTALARPLTEVIRDGLFIQAAGRLRGKRRAKKFEKAHPHKGGSLVELEYSQKYTVRLMPQINPGVEYDLAISFVTPHYFAAQRVRAKKRAFWIHTDYSELALDRESELAMWDRADYICGVSQSCADAFAAVFPELRKKITVVENILSAGAIRSQAALPVEDGITAANGEKTLCSVGRFCEAKNFDNVPAICRALVEKGLNVRWYLIGYGAEEALIRRRISEQGMEDRVIILGKKENPYPYMAACDVYAQPSRYEGKCVCVREAQLLQKPVLITDYTTAKSQVEDGVDGVIAPLDSNACAQALAALLEDEDKRRTLSENCAKRDYSNSAEARRIEEMLE